MKKRVWIVNYYTSSPELATNPRYLEFARLFQQKGYDVITFNSSVKHGTNINLIPDDSKFYEKQYGEFKFVHVKSPHYQGNGLKRMWSIFVFAIRLFFHHRDFSKPDIILHNLHTPFDYPIYWIAKRTKAKYIAEAWDLWPRAFANYGLISDRSVFLKIAYAIERHIYVKADKVVFTMEGGIDYLRDHRWTTDTNGKIPPSKVFYINNGVNLDEFYRNSVQYPRRDADLNNPDIYKIIYVGSVRLINKVKELIDAAALLQKNPKYKLFIYGDGSDRPFLEQYIIDNRIDNVVFKEKRIPLWEVAWVVSQATVNIMNYEPGFGHYGASSGKMFQYFAAGKPICCNIKLNYSEISRNNLGIDRDMNTPEEYAAAIQELAEQPQIEYDAMCERVRQTAKRFDYKVLAAKELKVIESVLVTN